MKTAISFILLAFLLLLGGAKSDNKQSVIGQASGSSDANSENHRFARDVLKELIEINTTERFGSTKAAEAI